MVGTIGHINFATVERYRHTKRTGGNQFTYLPFLFLPCLLCASTAHPLTKSFSPLDQSQIALCTQNHKSIAKDDQFRLLLHSHLTVTIKYMLELWTGGLTWMGLVKCIAKENLSRCHILKPTVVRVQANYYIFIAACCFIMRESALSK